MKTEVLEEMVRKWEEEAVSSETVDGSKDAELRNANKDGEREGRYKCAQDLRKLISLLG
jgi:hypothetical protein